jgi:hypothetical protein
MRMFPSLPTEMSCLSSGLNCSELTALQKKKKKCNTIKKKKKIDKQQKLTQKKKKIPPSPPSLHTPRVPFKTINELSIHTP